jgi:hypothetical protein
VTVLYVLWRLDRQPPRRDHAERRWRVPGAAAQPIPVQGQLHVERRGVAAVAEGLRALAPVRLAPLYTVAAARLTSRTGLEGIVTTDMWTSSSMNHLGAGCFVDRAHQRHEDATRRSHSGETVRSERPFINRSAETLNQGEHALGPSAGTSSAVSSVITSRDGEG